MSASHRKTRLLAGMATLVFAAGAHAHEALAAAPGALAKSMREAQPARAAKPASVTDKATADAAAPGEVRSGVPTGRYFVKLTQPSLVQQLARERAVRGGTQPLALQSGVALAREASIRQEQRAALASFGRVLGRNVVPKLSYAKALNGFSLQLSEREAALLAQDPAVAAVRPVLDEHLHTDVGPALIGAPSVWDGSATGIATSGEGVTVGIIDTGINSDHPSFAATAGSYTHTNPLGAGSYLGWCATPENASFCNDKLIGAYDFVYALVQNDPNASDGPSPEDNDSHGSHTASTTAGNRITATYGPVPNIALSGVAPRANIVAYDTCYRQISTGRGLCPGDATAAAVEQAIDDGVVSVLNFSIGGGVDPYNDMVSEAFLAATEMGIYVAASAGNDGPGASTLGHQEPWVGTTAASTHGRRFGGTVGVTGPGTPPANVAAIPYLASTGVPVTAPISAPIARANIGTNFYACSPYAGTPFAGSIVLVPYESPACSTATKVTNLQAAGALAVILHYQFPNPLPTPTGLSGLTTPAVIIGSTPGSALGQFIDSNPGATATVGTAGSVIFDTVDAMASFSSRGPNSRIDVLKPDVSGPGVSIFAAVADGFGVGTAGTEVGLLSGTSMSSPHHAGTAALLQALRPEWTPMQIKSALMLTAKSTGMLKENGITPATPFDYGNGRIRVAAAANAGLVMDETITAFEAADPALFGDPRTLNLASLYSSRCVGAVGCVFERRFTNPGTSTVTWNIGFQPPADVTMSANTSSITVAPGETATVTFTADATALAPAAGFRFGEVVLSDASATLAPLHLSVALRAVSYVMPDRFRVRSARDAGGRVFESLAVPAATDLTFLPAGLVRGTQVTQTLATDPDGAPFNNLAQVYYTLITPTQDAVRLVADLVESSASDLDLYIGRDTNNDGLPRQSEVIATAATDAVLESLDVRNLAATSNYWILVQNYAGSGVPDSFTLSHAWVTRTDAGNLSVDAPAAPAAGAPFAATVTFDEPAMLPGERWYGAFEIGADPQAAATAQYGVLPVDIVRVEDDVVKSADRSTAAPGDVVTYSVAVAPNITMQELQYTVADTLPTGLTLLPGSAQASAGTVSAVGNTVQWTLAQPSGGFDALARGPVKGTGALLTYAASVDAFVGDPRVLTNLAQHDTDAVGTREETSSASVVATGLDPADLAVTLTDAPDPLVAGSGPITYTVAVVNGSGVAATGVGASITLAAGVDYVGASGSDWTCVAAATVECTLAGPLAAGASAELQLVANVPPSTHGAVNASVTVTAATPDPDTANNTATATTAVIALPDVFADGFED